MTDIASNLEQVLAAIRKTAVASNRVAADIKLVAVSKTKSVEEIRAALSAGHRSFGENRVQEAKSKFTTLREDYPDIELHLIGPLQTNKVEEAVKLFDVIETLDRPKLAEALAKAVKKTGRTPRFYIEVNSGGEEQKAGINPQELGAFLAYCRQDCGLSIEGLMCIPPQGEDPAPHFKKLKQLATQHNLSVLSMGMSADYKTAIECGATSVRVGTAIFGARNTIPQ